MFTDEEFEDLYESFRLKMRDAHLSCAETLQYNLRKRAFEHFPGAFSHDQEQVLIRIAEEVLRACNSLCAAYSVRAIEGALQLSEEGNNALNE